MGQDIKLTERLPEHLHAALRARAGRRHRSVNREIVDTLARGLAAGERGVGQDRDAVASLLITAGLWEPGLSWRDVPGPPVEPDPDYTALRVAMGVIPPLSEAIIEDRGPT